MYLAANTTWEASWGLLLFQVEELMKARVKEPTFSVTGCFNSRKEEINCNTHAQTSSEPKVSH